MPGEKTHCFNENLLSIVNHSIQTTQTGYKKYIKPIYISDIYNMPILYIINMYDRFVLNIIATFLQIVIYSRSVKLS